MSGFVDEEAQEDSSGDEFGETLNRNPISDDDENGDNDMEDEDEDEDGWL